MDQSFVYENGVLISCQSSRDLVVLRPAFSVIDSEDLSFSIIKLSGIGGKTSASGYGTHPLRTKFSVSETSYINNLKQITIYYFYTNAWPNFFNNTLSNSILNFSIDDTIAGDGITITFSDTNQADLPELSLNVVEIEIQISPGWVR